MKIRSFMLLAALLALGACDSKNKKVDKPAELTDIKNPTVRIQKLWGASVGGGGKKLRLGSGPGRDRTTSCSRRAVTAMWPRSISRPANSSGARRPSWRSPVAPASAASSSSSVRPTVRWFALAARQRRAALARGREGRNPLGARRGRQ